MRECLGFRIFCEIINMIFGQPVGRFLEQHPGNLLQAAQVVTDRHGHVLGAVALVGRAQVDEHGRNLLPAPQRRGDGVRQRAAVRLPERVLEPVPQVAHGVLGLAAGDRPDYVGLGAAGRGLVDWALVRLDLADFLQGYAVHLGDHGVFQVRWLEDRLGIES